ncbi:M3 family metallopeptidase [Halobacteriovorax sp. GB3]|uniref:M3 family metallopeptidase n=1 Tax=Halobacteriovorax sp. GB3 TaxID=2719615 RepID=UPI002362AA1F|nr:M3 family metallopeptidase [Halobacteriovorax sp. GB3]MDD0854217.1 M3 family metallopeptidase [Halobacteriovorax sp. GB3]
MNPLLEKFDTPFGTIPFDKLKNEHFMPALDEAIKIAKEKIEAVKANTEEPTFENVILEMENSDLLLDSVTLAFFNLTSAETNDEMTEISKEFSPKLTAFGNDISLDEKLFEKVKAVYDKRETLGLNQEQATLLDKVYKSFSRNGALLSEDKKEKLREIDKELSTLGVQFSDNVLKETNEFVMFVENESDLEGLPEGVREAAAMEAKERGEEGKWAFTLQYPSYVPFIMYSSKRELREKMARAFGSKAFKGNERDNRDIVKRIASLRYERANLLGYNTHADFVLEERMAQKPENVFNLLNELKDKALDAGKEHMEDVKAYAKKIDGIEELKSWDYAFYFEKMKKEKFNIDDEMLKPYFKLENVIDGVFTVAKKLFGLTFEQRNDIPKYHEDVLTYEVKDKDGKHISVFYADFFPRAGKRGGAWMTLFREQRVDNGEDMRPHVSIVCNFTKPTETKPSLLTFNEVTTLFHEFGHALHGMLSKCTYKSIAGTNVFWDFVELPSQVLENWAYEKECLDLFAKHYETGELIPTDLVQKLKDSSNYGEGRATLRQLGLGLLDLAWHAGNPSDVSDVDQFEKEATKEVALLSPVDGTNTSCSFGHIFAGGYSAGYYSYKWAEVLDADAFEYFKTNGIFNEEIAAKFHDNVLSRGGSEHPMELYKKFRGQEPSTDALLRRAGLL